MLQLRTKWYSLFFRRIHNPSKSWQAEDEAVLSAIINILSSEDQVAGLTVSRVLVGLKLNGQFFKSLLDLFSPEFLQFLCTVSYFESKIDHAVEFKL